MGRPSTYTQEKGDEICELLIEGLSLRKIAAIEGMPKPITILKWLRDYPEFAVQYARAREEQAEAFADEMIDIADDISRDITVDSEGKHVIDGFAAQRAKVMIDTRKWIAAKLKPKKYGEKIDLNHAGQEGAPPIKTSVTVEFVNAKQDSDTGSV